MIATDEDALICDLAETYGIYNYRGLPVQLLGVLASGLRDNSRIKMKLAGTKITTEQMLLASMVDRLGILAWQNTEDARKGRNRPASILDILMGLQDKAEKDIMAFDSGQSFEDEWNRLLRKEGI